MKPRILASPVIGTGYYHCISRVVDKQRIFGDREKARLVADMTRHAAFGHLRIVTYCMMSNHFHILVEAPPRPSPEEIARMFPDDDALEAHLAATLGGKALKQFVQMRWMAREHHNELGLIKMRESLLRRMWNLSEFMRGFKQDFTIWFNGTHNREGTLWESRFKSVLVEPGQALATVAAYIDLNPIRANIVDDPADYLWCGYAQAMAGNSLALTGLEIVARQCGLEAEAVLKERRLKVEIGQEASGTRLVPALSDTAGKMPELLFEASEAGRGKAAHGVCGPLSETPGKMRGLRSEALSPEAILARYRLALYGDAITVETNEDGSPGQRGFSRETVMEVIKAGGKVSSQQLIRCKVRHFADGVAVGSKSFVESVFQNCRDLFSPKRKDGARPLRATPKEGRLFALRDLRKFPVT